jgi:hypothetical protein
MATVSVKRRPAPIEEVTLKLSHPEAARLLQALEGLDADPFDRVSSIAAILRAALRPAAAPAPASANGSDW